VHAQRGFFEVHASTKSPIVAHALAQIAALYAIEAEIRGQPAALRQAGGRNAPGRSSRRSMSG